MGLTPVDPGRIQRTCCDDPSWARWRVVDVEGYDVQGYFLTKLGARWWIRRHDIRKHDIVV